MNVMADPSSLSESTGPIKSSSGSTSSAGAKDTSLENVLLPIQQAGSADGSGPMYEVSQIDPQVAQTVAGFLIQEGTNSAQQLLARIRSRRPLDIYLKPVVLNPASTDGISSRTEAAFDACWELGDAPGSTPIPHRDLPSSIRNRIDSINRRIHQIREGGSTEEGSLGIRLLRFMATRKSTFTPIRTSEVKDGFVYPQLQPLLEGTGRVVIPVLSALEKRGRLRGDFVTRRHACINCRSGFLNFIETCPDCGSANLEVDDLVHHFRCAYTGPIWEYQQEDIPLSCPKCDRELRQIGVDYDKPSLAYLCNQCGNQFQDPTVRTDCYHCGHSSPPEQQIEETIKEYSLTSPGEQAAIHGTGSSFLTDLRETTNVLDYSSFQIVLSTEAERARRQNYTSTLLIVRLAGIYEVQSGLSRGSSQKIIEEVARLFDEAADASDYLGVHHSIFFLLLTDTDQEEASAEGERLRRSVRQVQGDGPDSPIGIQLDIWPANEDLHLDSVIQEFLSDRV